MGSAKPGGNNKSEIRASQDISVGHYGMESIVASTFAASAS